ncbi:tryptophan 2,3-dioxygenase [Streptomyces sp. NPDC102394]|uniref:tryptophan 2,3-dioxygenase n=1 Tax=Streptomyces sp. NPDC102394 TaxID=3366167 RepID=UPI00381E1858
MTSVPAVTAPAPTDSLADTMHALDLWQRTAEPHAFPYLTLLGHLRAVGKHFLAEELLEQLALLRGTLPRVAALDASASGGTAQERQPSGRFLRTFLDVVLDKHDHRYDYPSYIGLPLLARPSAVPWQEARRLRDETLLLLLADLVHFEQQALGDDPAAPHGMPPGADLVAKRIRLAVRVMEPAALRILPPGVVDPAAVAAVPGRSPGLPLARAVLRTATAHDELMLSATMQPVYVLHDEYLFLRTLQSFETTFSFMSASLATAVRCLGENRPEQAAARVGAVADVLKESLPLFSLLATMRPEAFRTFRDFTEGASAIQSAGYKTFESLCSTPAAARLDSPAFTSVPSVRARVLHGRPTVQGTWSDLAAAHRLTPEAETALDTAAARLEAVHQRWKQTHYRLAVRMLGERTGTGYTQGVPYLASVLDNRLFPAGDRDSALVG